MKRLTYIILTIVALAGCQPYDIDEILLTRNDLSITVKGVLQMSYDPLTCQMAHNTTDNEYRVYDDDLADWFVVKCDTKPTYEGQELRVTVTWTTTDDIRRESNLEFEVHRIDSKGKIWMWNDSKDIGVVIQEL